MAMLHRPIRTHEPRKVEKNGLITHGGSRFETHR
jgi:hypothetical protein